MLQPGTQVGRYEIQRKLGRGGMGTVYVAHDPILGRMVAIKMFLGDLDLPDAAERFAREARSAAALNHANIVTVHDYGEFSSQPYIVMEYVQGETLAEIVRRKAPIPLTEKLRWIEELCVGVAYAHHGGVIHRDIKPTNLMVDRSGRLKILDFGIARMLRTLASKGTALIGTPGYMAPEQIVGGTIDQRSDLFSVGVVCYELLSYADAFPGDTVPTIAHRILNEEPVPLSQLNPDLNPELVAIVERGMKKRAAERFDDGESFGEAIGRVRRQLESGPGWDVAPSPLGSGAMPAGGNSSRGTGSARQRFDGAVGVAELTPPPPDPPRSTDREALARRRVAQIEASLAQARTLFDGGDLDAAMDACLQALTLDDTNAIALQLEEAIKSVSARKRAAALIQEAREELGKGALTGAQDLLQQARFLEPDAPEAKRLERDLRIARVEQDRLRKRAEGFKMAIAAAELALRRSQVEAALAFAREALEIDPGSEEARSLEAEAMRRLDEDTDNAPTVLAQSPVARPGRIAAASGAAEVSTVAAPLRAPSPPTPGKPAVPAARHLENALLPALRTLAASVQASVNARSPRGKPIITGATVAVLIMAAAVAWWIVTPAAVPMGIVMLEAVPWANITGIEAEDGTRPPVPSPSSTPLLLNLPAGTYRISLVGPPPASESRLVTLRVQAGVVTDAPVERFRGLTPEEYFEQYLPSAAPTTTAPAAAAPPDGVR